MNKTITSLLAFGAGMVTYNMAQKNDLMTKRNMKKMQKRITKLF